jgi:hypothetical protein
MLGIDTVYPIPQQLQGFATDDVFDTPSIKSAQVQMGVDGNMSAGFVFVEIPQSYRFQGDSPSCDVFDNWWAANQAANDEFFANATISLKALGKKYTMTKGVLTDYKPTSEVKALIQRREFTITWNRLSVASV